MPVEYIVMFRSKQWWVTCDGIAAGPFIAKNAALAAALYRAKLDFKTGVQSRVSVQEDELAVVYDSSV